MKQRDRPAATRRTRPILALGATAAVVALAALLAAAGSAMASSGSTPSGPITICHKTGSTLTPWVTLTIDIHAWPKHLQHGDKLGACPTPPAPTGKTVAICHYTGLATQPWVTIRINIRAWPGHPKHGDLLGACPDPPPPLPTKKHGKGEKNDGSPDPGQGSASDGGHPHHK